MADSVFMGRGDVNGPASATDGALAAFDGTSGKLIKVGSASGVYVSSITGTANQITASAATGAVTLSIPSTFIAPGSVTPTTGLLAPANNTVDIGASGTAFRTGYFGTSVVVGQGTITAANSPISVTSTWNNGAVAFDGVKLAFTETASAATSRYFQVLGGVGGATDEFYVYKGGNTFIRGQLELSSGGAIVSAPGVGIIGFGADATHAVSALLTTDNTIWFKDRAGTGDTATVKANTVNATGAFSANGTAGVATFGPAAVASITIKGGIVTAIS